MRYRASDIPALLRSPVGRLEFTKSVFNTAWPVLRPLAGAHRRLLGRRTTTVAVVGSYAKTSTARAVAAVLGLDPASLATSNALSDVALGVFRMNPFRRYTVMEVGIDQPGQMQPYANAVRPNIVVATGVGSEHHRSLGTLEVTREEKSMMAAVLPADGLAVLNGDDPNVLWMRTRTAARVVTFGFSAGCDVRAVSAELDWPNGMRLEVETPEGTHAVCVPWFGRHMVYPALAAIAVGLERDIPVGTIVERLAAVPPTPGRMQLVRGEDGVYVLRDDFKSAIETVHAALDTLAAIPVARKMVVMGDVSEPPGSMGPIYREIGAQIARTATYAVFLGGGADRYAVGVRSAGFTRDQFDDAGRSVARAIELVRARVRPGDVVLVKGPDTQRLDRVSLGLLGQTVRCGLEVCSLKVVRCADCPVLAQADPVAQPPWGRRSRV